MPYFKWFGYDAHGNPHTGYSACADNHELITLLAAQNITHVRSGVITHRFTQPCSFTERQDVLTELAQLLQAHIRLSQALAIMSSLTKNEYIRQVLLACMRDVDRGKSFAESIEHYPDLFDPLTLYALKAGYHSGFLAVAATERAQQLAEIAEIRSKIRTALTMPLISATFFVVIVIFLILFILPQFERIFTLLKVTLPWYTVALITLNNELTFAHISVACAVIIALVTVFLFFRTTHLGKKTRDVFFLYTPVISAIYSDLTRAQILQSIALLLRSGQTLAQALTHVVETVNNSIVQAQLIHVQRDIEQGKQFAVAIQQCRLLAVPEIESGVSVAHETAQLEVVLQQLGVIFRARAMKKLDRITLVIQPILLMLLGAAVCIILLALYVPLLKIPQSF